MPASDLSWFLQDKQFLGGGGHPHSGMNEGRCHVSDLRTRTPTEWAGRLPAGMELLRAAPGTAVLSALPGDTWPVPTGPCRGMARAAPCPVRLRARGSAGRDRDQPRVPRLVWERLPLAAATVLVPGAAGHLSLCPGLTGLEGDSPKAFAYFVFTPACRNDLSGDQATPVCPGHAMAGSRGHWPRVSEQC